MAAKHKGRTLFKAYSIFKPLIAHHVFVCPRGKLPAEMKSLWV
jgi:hypothetical protein